MSSRPSERGDRHAVVPVAHEVQLADAVDRDRRERLAAALGLGDPLPARRAPAGSWGGSARSKSCVRSTVPTIESSGDGLQPEVELADEAERLDDLVEREDEADVVGLAAQPPREVGEQPRPPRPGEVALRVRGGEAGDRCPPGERP